MLEQITVDPRWVSDIGTGTSDNVFEEDSQLGDLVGNPNGVVALIAMAGGVESAKLDGISVLRTNSNERE